MPYRTNPRPRVVLQENSGWKPRQTVQRGPAITLSFVMAIQTSRSAYLLQGSSAACIQAKPAPPQGRPTFKGLSRAQRKTGKQEKKWHLWSPRRPVQVAAQFCNGKQTHLLLDGIVVPHVWVWLLAF